MDLICRSLITSLEMAVLVRYAVVAGARMDKDACYVVAFAGTFGREHGLLDVQVEEYPRREVEIVSYSQSSAGSHRKPQGEYRRNTNGDQCSAATAVVNGDDVAVKVRYTSSSEHVKTSVSPPSSRSMSLPAREGGGGDGDDGEGEMVVINVAVKRFLRC